MPFSLPFLPASEPRGACGGAFPALLGLEIELSACPALKRSERAGGERQERVYENKCGDECLRSRACPGKASGRQV